MERRADAEGDKVTAGKVVAGKAEAAREITLADWKLKREPIPKEEGDASPGVIVTRAGEVWLTKCLTRRTEAGCKVGYLRIDQAAALATRRPADVIYDWNSGVPEAVAPERPAVAAPAGYTAEIKKTKIRKTTLVGVICKGPHGTYEWPEVAKDPDPKLVSDDILAVMMDKGQATRVDWVSATPPMIRYVVKSPHFTAATYVEDCGQERPAPRALHDGRWLDGEIVRRADGSELGKLRGGASAAVAR
jgi:hypothetical protein